MRFGVILGVLLVVVAAMSGCTSSDSKKAADEGVKPKVDPDGDLGSIAGIVMDPEQSPVASALLGLTETGAETKTDVTGAFAFNDLEPGEYTVQVQRLGYEGQPKKVTVIAGEIAPLDFIIVPLAVQEPYYETFIQEGMIGCGASLPVVTATTCYGNAETDDPFLEFNATKGARISLTEVTWESTSATTGKELLVNRYLKYKGEDWQDMGRNSGPSPIRFQTEFDDIEEGDIVEIEDDVFVNFFSQTNPSPVAYQQRFTAYFTVFYDMDIPADFTALPPS